MNYNLICPHCGQRFWTPFAKATHLKTCSAESIAVKAWLDWWVTVQRKRKFTRKVQP